MTAKLDKESLSEKAIREQLQLIIPKAGCKKCHGVGQLGVYADTLKPILCRCVTKQIDQLIRLRNALPKTQPLQLPS